MRMIAAGYAMCIWFEGATEQFKAVSKKSIKKLHEHQDQKTLSESEVALICSPGDVGMDLYSLEDYVFEAWTTQSFQLGLPWNFRKAMRLSWRTKSSLPKTPAYTPWVVS